MDKIRYVILVNGTYYRLLTLVLSMLLATVCTVATAQINKSTIDTPQIVDDPTLDLPKYPPFPVDDPIRPPTIPIELPQPYIVPLGNYILERTPRTPVKSIDELNCKSPSLQGVRYSYLDLFNRPIQQVTAVTKAGILESIYSYLIFLHEYDSLGREMKGYIPYPSCTGTYSTSALADLKKYYKLTFEDNVVPYTERTETDVYSNNSVETSLLGYSLADGHNTKVTLDLNSANEVPYRKIRDNGTIYADGYYPEGSLIRKEVKDANGKVSVAFTTEDERTIRVIDDINGIKPTTDYVYDDLDRLVWILPPNVVSEYDNVLSSSIAQKLSGSTTLKNSSSNAAYVLKSSASMTIEPDFVCTPGFSVSFSADPIDKLLDKAYYYRYDQLGRLVCKKLPDIDSVYMVYDKYNRLVATQDGNLRQTKKWQYVRYDELNRVLETGLMANGIVSQTQMQNKVDATYNSGSNSIAESLSGDKYTMNNFPHSSDGTIEPLSYNFYGTYDVTNCPVYVESEKYENKVDAVAGLPTVVRYANLTDKTWNIKACYYNADLRPIQQVNKRTIKRGNSNIELQDVTSVQYDSFTGKKLQERLTQTVAGSSNTITNRYEYYDNDLLKNVFEKLNSGVEEQVVHYTYDDFGRVEQKHYGYEAQKNSYGYDIRGALTKINYSGDKGMDINAFFSMTVGYDKPQDVGINGGSLDAYGVKGQYNGNVSAIAWRSRQQDGTEKKRGYAFKYDGMNRLSQSYFAEGANLPISGAYTEKDIIYDLMGNIKTLTRTTSNSTASTTSYSYDGNKLTSVNGSSTYRYDNNGNAIFDGKSGFTIDYNELNLPKKVSKGSDNTSYSYNANGELQSVTDPDGSTRYYMGNMVYDGSFKLMYVQGSEGLILPNNRYQYNLTDHLGSTRVVFSKAAGEGLVAVVEQSTDYYPYGKSFDNMNVSKNPYLYNGKELQAQVMAGTHFDWYNHGARFYDPELGLWHSVDPKMEKRFGESGFGFCGGNPTSRVDPDGQFYWPFLYMLAGSYLNASRANRTFNPFKWEYNTQTYSAMAVGAAGGAFMGQYLSGNNGLLTSGSNSSLDIRLSANYKDLVAGGTTFSVGQGLLTLRSADYVTRAGGGMGVNINKTWNIDAEHFLRSTSKTVDYTTFGIGSAQLGFLQYRRSLSLNNKIGSFSQFRSFYNNFGYTADILNKAGYAGVAMNTYLDYRDLQDGEIGELGFGYKTGSSIYALGAGFLLGGPMGAVGGVLLSVGFGELYDQILVPAWNETKYQMWNFQNQVTNGRWYPGIRNY